MLGEHVEIDNDCWNLLILFCQLTDEALYTFFSKYMSKFPDTIIKPKAHFIQHYRQMISCFGPLVKTFKV